MTHTTIVVGIVLNMLLQILFLVWDNVEREKQLWFKLRTIVKWGGGACCSFLIFNFIFFAGW